MKISSDEIRPVCIGFCKPVLVTLVIPRNGCWLKSGVFKFFPMYRFFALIYGQPAWFSSRTGIGNLQLFLRPLQGRMLKFGEESARMTLHKFHNSSGEDLFLLEINTFSANKTFFVAPTALFFP